MTIINSGAISGGIAGEHSPREEAFRANAITFTGGTNRLELHNGSTIIGKVTANGTNDTFALGGTSNGTFDVSEIGGSAQYQGFEHFVKTGSSAWMLTHMNSAISSWSVNDGLLSVNGNMSNTVFTVNSGGSLGGSGAVGEVSVLNSATVAPGNSPGTLHAANITFNAGSIYQAQVLPTGEHDLIDISGTATINGGTVQVLAGGGNYALSTEYNILTADGGLAGNKQFAGVTSNLVFLDPSLAYDANNVYLTMARNDISFASIGRTRNQKATGAAVENLVFGSPVFDAATNLSAEQARYAFDQLSGEIYASAKSALIEDSHFIRDAVNSRIRSAFGDLSAPPMPAMAYGKAGPRPASPDSPGLVAWGHAFGSWGSFDGDGNAAAMDTSTGGFLAGIDGEVASDIRFGFLTGYSHSTFDVDGRSSSGSSDNYHLGLYAGARWNALRLSGGLAYTWHDIETSRSVAFPGFSDSLKGDYSAGTFQAFGEAGYRITVGAASFEPFANLAYVNLHTDGFTEKGGDAALHVHGETTETTFTTLGIHLSSPFDLGSVKAMARGTLGWRHAFGDVTPSSTHAFASGDPFDIAGVPVAKDAALVEGGLDLNLTEATTLGIAWQGQFGSGAMQNGFKADLSVRF